MPSLHYLVGYHRNLFARIGYHATKYNLFVKGYGALFWLY